MRWRGSHVGVGLAAGASAIVLLAAAAGATANVSTRRLAGATRFETAQAVATATYANATTAVVASGEDFPDALAASYMAGAIKGPVLLTTKTTLAPQALDALRALGASGVQVVGGPAAVSEDVVTVLRQNGFVVERVFGVDRYATAQAIAEAEGPDFVASLPGSGRTALLASGQNFPDALAGGPLAYAAFPMLLTPSAGPLPSFTRQALTNLGIQHVMILGGTGAVSSAVEAEVTGMGLSTRRLAGASRQATATAIADFAVATLAFSNAHVNLARGDNFPDALAGGPHGGEERRPILLTVNIGALGSDSAAYLQAHRDTIAAIDVFGGAAAVSDAVVSAAQAAATS